MTRESVSLIPSSFRRPGRACPCHPRRTGPQGAPDGCGPLRDRSGRGTARVPGTGPGMTREGVRLVPFMVPPSWPGLSRPPTPDRAAGRTERLRPPPGPVRPRHGVGARDRPGHDAGGREACPHMIPPSWPGLSRPPTPDRAAGRTERLRPPPGPVRSRHGVGARDRPGHDAGGREARPLHGSAVLAGLVPATHAGPGRRAHRTAAAPSGTGPAAARRGCPGQARA